MTIEEQLLAPDVGAVVHLFEIDLSPISPAGGSIFITPATEGAPPTEVARGGQTYTACPIAIEGLERGGTSTLPTPTLNVANVAGLISAWVDGAQDMLGALVTRTTVLASWLDGGTAADPTARISADTYYIAQKTAQNAERLTFSLRSTLDNRRAIPFRKATAKCAHTYRWKSLSSWVLGTCPYTAGPMYTHYDTPTSYSAQDVCSRRLTGCQARFGTVAPLPFFGFPSLEAD